MDSDTTSAATARFATLAREFRDWCEAPSLGTDATLHAQWLIARVHAAALTLPATDCGNDDEAEPPQAALSRARANLGVFAGWYYREVWHPDPELNEDPVMGDVGDDLLDIYLDLRRGLVLFDAGHGNEALWHWSFLHTIHWGRHAVGAMFALHCKHTVSAA